MRILYHHRTRATDAQKVHILEMIGAFRELGHTVTVASLVRTENRETPPERDAAEPFWKKIARRLPWISELVQLGYNAVGFPWLLFKAVQSNADLIYERYSLFTFSGVLAAAVAGRPIVLEVNSPLALEMAREKAIKATRFAHWMERVICNSATKVVVVSEALRRIMIRNGVHESKLYLMPNGVNVKRFSGYANPQLRTSLGIGDRKAIGCVGWFRPWHGLELLLEAFHKSGLADGRAVLLLIGDGPSMPALKSYVDAAGIQDSVIFAGPVDHAQVPSYLHLIDIAVQPAANEYCCPMKILEYMGLAKAIVAPRQENIAELLEDGRDALLFEPGDVQSLSQALVALATDAGLRSRSGASAMATIQARDLFWESNARKIVSMFEPVPNAASTAVP